MNKSKTRTSTKGHVSDTKKRVAKVKKRKKKNDNNFVSFTSTKSQKYLSSLLLI